MTRIRNHLPGLGLLGSLLAASGVILGSAGCHSMLDSTPNAGPLSAVRLLPSKTTGAKFRRQVEADDFPSGPGVED